MGNGAKAAQKRERAAGQEKKGKSQLKANEAAKTLVCDTCKQPFMNTSRRPALQQHAESKHSKTVAECFPSFTD